VARVGRRVAPLTLDTLDDLPAGCRTCLRWEVAPVDQARARADGSASLDKESWVSATLLDWGSCGRVLYVDEEPAGYLMYAPPWRVPRSTGFATAPAGADAVLLTAAHVRPEHRGGGLGRVLVQSMVKDLAQRGVRAVEAYGALGDDVADRECLVPAGFLLAVGFKTVRAHPRHPRLRMDLRTAVSWREDVEVALERLLGSITPTPLGAHREQSPPAGSPG